MLLSLVIANIVFVLTCFFGGYVLRRFFLPANNNNEFLFCLEHIFLGLVIIVTGYSLIVTKGVSVNVVVVPVLIYLAWLKKKEPIVLTKTGSRTLWYSLLCIPVIIPFLLFHLFQFHNVTDVLKGDIAYTTRLPFYDLSFYADNAAKMNSTGIEGFAFNQIEILPANEYRVPYHYFDLWINGLLQTCFSFSRSVTYLYIFQPFAYLLCFLSVGAVIKHFSAFGFFKILSLALPGVFFIEMFTLASDLPLLFTKANTLENPKYFTAICCVSLMVCYFKQHRSAGLAILCLLPVFHILAVLPVLGFIFLCGMAVFVLSAKQQAIQWMSLAIVTGVSILLFYMAAGNLSTMFQSGNNSGFSFQQFDAITWMCIIGILILAAIFLKKRDLLQRNKYELLFCLSLLVLLSMLFASVIKPMHRDGVQIKFLPGVTVFRVMVIIGIAMIIKKSRTGYLLVLAMVVALGAYRATHVWKGKIKVDKNFQAKTDAIFKSGENIAYVYNEKHQKIMMLGNTNVVFRGLEFPLLLKKDVKCISITKPVNPDSLRAGMGIPTRFIKRGSFYRFIEENKYPGSDIYKAQYHFLKQNGFRHVVLDAGLDTVGFYRSITRRILRDSISGISVIELN